MAYLTGINNVASIISLNLNLSNHNMSSKKFYSIPLNQREFVWTNSVVKQLLNDISESIKSSTEDFFLGAIVLSLEPLQPVISHGEIINIDVVDGQQRFTSLTIILSILYAHANLYKNDFISKYADNITKRIEIEDFYSDYIERIGQYLLYRPEGSSTKKPILQVSQVFRDLYDEVIDTYLRNMSKQPVDDIYDTFQQMTKSAHESSFSRMIQVAGETKDFIASDLNDNDFDSLKKFVTYLMDKVQVVVTATETLNSAFNVFESLNGRGIGLLPEDLIKNYLFKNIEENSNYVTSVGIWNDFIKNLKKDSSENYQFLPSYFFDLFFLSKGIIVTKSQLFDAFTDSEHVQISTDIEINTFLTNIKDLSQFLSQQYLSLHALRRIGFGLGFSTILSLSKHRTDSNYKQYIDQIARLGFVLLISKDKKIKEKVRDLNKIIKSYTIDAEVTLLESIKTYIDNIVEDLREDFTSRLKILKVGRTGDGNNKAKYMLAVASEKLDGSSYDLSLTNTQIEHFLPITRNGNCQEVYTDVEYSAYKSRLGNVTIMRQTPNQWNSNHCFSHKIQRIIDTQSSEVLTSSVYQEIPLEHCAPLYKEYRIKFDYHRTDLASPLWSKEDIEKRTSSLVKLAEYIWIDGN